MSKGRPPTSKRSTSLLCVPVVRSSHVVASDQVREINPKLVPSSSISIYSSCKRCERCLHHNGALKWGVRADQWQVLGSTW
jgi:hypothetical protein